MNKKGPLEDESKEVKKIIIKKCHQCAHLIESFKEIKSCPKCHKHFLPSDYFKKVHTKNGREFSELFQNSDEIVEETLVKGIHVLW